MRGERPRVALYWYLCAGVLATSATQLRLPGAPVGPGELLLVLWMAAVGIFFFVGRTRWAIQSGVWPLVGFWIVSFPAMAAGVVASTVAGHAEDSGATRDVFAMLFVSVFSVVLAISVQSAAAARRVLGLYSLVAAYGLVLLLGFAIVVRAAGPIDFWYQLIRFVGLATNPNQLALFVAAGPFVLAQALADGGVGYPRLYWGAMAAMIVVGIATTSDALMVAWISGLGVAVSWKWIQEIRKEHGSILRPALLVVVVPLWVVGLLVLVGLPLYRSVEAEVVTLIQLGSQASVRLTLWGNGVAALAASPFFGWGPGAHSGIGRAFEAMEAHSTYVDWAASTGLIGLCALLCLVIATLMRCVLANKVYLALAVLSLATFSSFHYVLRQPVFWFYLVTILASVSKFPRQVARSPFPRAGELDRVRGG